MKREDKLAFLWMMVGTIQAATRENLRDDQIKIIKEIARDIK